MIFAKVDPDAEQILLDALKQASDARWYRRVKIIHLSSQRTTVPELARLFECCPATIRQYIKQYNAQGLAGLQRQSSDGPPVKITLTQTEWEEVLHRSPSQFDRLQTGVRNWTQALVVEYLRAYHDISVTQSAVSHCLRRHKISWNRGALKVTSPDPLYTVKRERIDTLKKRPLREP